MDIRPATEQDMIQIVQLLKESLGESLLPKSERYWRWKHLENPFGSSPVLVAEEHGEIIGVRAFMKWRWEIGAQQYSAVRAVDTATHPKHQGKGIFKKLTLALVAQSIQQQVDLVFNTPNGQSRPGYLKMGWNEAGRLPIQLRPVSILGMIRGVLKGSSESAQVTSPADLFNNAAFNELLVKDKTFRSDICTAYSSAYLRWRYVDVPVVRYTGMMTTIDNAALCVIGRLKQTRLGTEFRITDLFCSEQQVNSGGKKSILAFAKTLKADYVTCSGKLNRLSLGVTLNQGPIVTIRKLATSEEEKFLNFAQWSPSLGDLELF